MLVDRNDECRVNDAWAERLEQVQDENTRRDRRVFERPDRRALFDALYGRVGPFEDLLVGDGATRTRERRERLCNVQPTARQSALTNRETGRTA